MAANRYFATTGKGLETVLAAEIAALGGKNVETVTGGVSFTGGASLGYRANLWLRTAGRVLLHLSDFDAPTPQALYEGVAAVSWPALFSVGRTIAVDATVRDSGITHSHFAAQKAKDAVVDRFRADMGARPNVDPAFPDVRINIRIVSDRCTLSLDLSGESLNRRGYRGDPADASLKETLAAGMILLAGWDGTVPLVDPTCGAGTIPIEAALIASRTAPGLLRGAFSFQKLIRYDRRVWDALVAEARDLVVPSPPGRIAGSDVSEKAIRAARRNARHAGMDDRIYLAVRDVRDLSTDGPPGVILCNPPYGVRIQGEPGAQPFYRALGESLKKRCRGWTAFLLSGNPDATRDLGLKASRRIPLMNGPIDCRLLRYDLY